jgi:hypothetical protein
MKKLKRILLWFIVGITVLVIGFVGWGSLAAQPMETAKQSLVSNEIVKVMVGNNLVFEPISSTANIGYIFYPGGKVDYRAYAPYAHALAEKGYLVVIPKMPLNLAVFGINKAKDIIANYPTIEKWVIGGHSLGGSMAANYLAKNPDQISGLILLASYPASTDDLSQYKGIVTSISASLDGLATKDKIGASRPLLPASTNWVVIQGGNHGNFGWYGNQKGDNMATITREVQQSIVIENSLKLFDQLKK